MGTLFSSGLQPTFLGYKAIELDKIFRNPDGLSTDEVAASGSLMTIQDPRGTFRNGMVPAKQLTYRVYERVDPVGFRADPTDVFAAFGISASTPFNFNLVQATTRTAVVVFEGRDVIDLSLADLKTEADSLVLPNKVFRVIHSGPSKFLNEGDSLPLKAAAAFWSYPAPPDNTFVRVVPSQDAPLDSQQASSAGLSRSFVDAMSNKVKVGLEASYISYVSVDKPILRDVVFMRQGAFAFLTNGMITGTGAGNIVVAMARFVPFDTRKSENDPSQMQWVLSETWGIKAQSIESIPSGLLATLTGDNRTKALNDSKSLHYVYNQKDHVAGQPDVSNDFFFVPLRTGIDPTLAKAKQQKDSGYYDANFFNQYFDYKLGYGASGGVGTTHAVELGKTSESLAPSFSYTSPTWVVQLGANARIGVEYSVQVPTGLSVFIPTETTLLAKTSPTTSGIAATYDSLLAKPSGRSLVPSRAFVYDTVDAAGGSTIVERRFSDVLWAVGGTLPSTSTLKQFLLGEAPLRSNGESILQDGLETIESLPLPSDFTALAIELQFSRGDNNPSLLLYESSTPSSSDKPKLEMNFIPGSDIDGALMIQPMKIGSFGADGVAISRFYGMRDTKELRASLADVTPSPEPLAGPSDDSTSWSSMSKMQLSKMEATKFSLSAGNVTSAYDNNAGVLFAAFEDSERIDMVVKKAENQPFSIIRDVTRRIPDDYNGDSTSALPDASLPFLLQDPVMNVMRLFYCYKKALLEKRIPRDIITNAPLTGRQFSLETERYLTESLLSLPAIVLYEADNATQSASSLKKDIELGTVSYPYGSRIQSDKKPNVTQYSSCFDPTGNVYLLLQTEEQLRIMYSNSRMEWNDAVTPGFDILPADGTQPDAISQIEAPFCMFDPLGYMMMFFFFDSGLFSLRIPRELLLNGATDNEAHWKKHLQDKRMIPTLLAGGITDGMKNRGLLVGPSVQEYGKTGDLPKKLTPHRIAGFVTSQGYHRVFFKDDEQVLRSLISIDSGITFLSESQLRPSSGSSS